MIVIIVMTPPPFFWHNLINMEKTVFQFWRHKFLFSILKNYTCHKSPAKCGQNHFQRKLKRFFQDSLEKLLTTFCNIFSHIKFTINENFFFSLSWIWNFFPKEVWYKNRRDLLFVLSYTFSGQFNNKSHYIK
jgi:hypothetical protein